MDTFSGQLLRKLCDPLIFCLIIVDLIQDFSADTDKVIFDCSN